MTTLTPLELAVMKSLWRRQNARVRDVQTDLLPGRRLAYTTVMTVLDRLFKKGAVRRTKKSRAHVYEPAFSEEEMRAAAVAGLLDNFFEGSRSRLRVYLVGEAAPRPEETPGREAPREPIDDSLL